MDSVISAVDDRGVATLTINRPDKANAFNDEVIYSMITALDDFANQEQIKLVYIKSTGKHFSSGVDVQWMAECLENGNSALYDDTTQMARLLSTLYHFPLPLVVSVQGAAYAESVGLVACCDIAIGSSDTVFIVNDVKFGIAPTLISPYLIKVMGEREARFYALTGLPINSEKALAKGLLNHVVPKENLETETNQCIDLLLQNCQESLLQTKSILQFCANEPFDDAAIDVTIELLCDLKKSINYKKGVNALLNKTTPNW